MSPAKLPVNLLEVIQHFSNPDVANAFVAALRWPNGSECPACGDCGLGYVNSPRPWQCKNKDCKWQFSV
jgi:Transposase zinc-ribbon domain